MHERSLMYVADLIGRVLGRLRLPVKPAHQLVKGLRILGQPRNYIRRRLQARTLIGNSPWGSFIDRSKGYALFGHDTIPDAERVVAVCRDIYENHRRQFDAEAAEPHAAKPFLYNVLDEKWLDEHPELLDFVISDPVALAVTGYLGTIPLLRGMGIYVSPRNDTSVSSQMFHTDYDDFQQVKCFINIVDVQESDGPFTFVPADTSTMIRAELGHGWRDRRLTDEEVLRYCSPADILKLIGLAGSGGMVDTSRCLHFGSRARTAPRVVFMFQYTSYPNVAFDHSERSSREGRPVYNFPGGRVAGNPLKQALLAADIQRTAGNGKLISSH